MASSSSPFAPANNSRGTGLSGAPVSAGASTSTNKDSNRHAAPPPAFNPFATYDESAGPAIVFKRKRSATPGPQSKALADLAPGFTQAYVELASAAKFLMTHVDGAASESKDTKTVLAYHEAMVRVKALLENNGLWQPISTISDKNMPAKSVEVITKFRSTLGQTFPLERQKPTPFSGASDLSGGPGLNGMIRVALYLQGWIDGSLLHDSIHGGLEEQEK